ncbi:MAG: nitroreductase family protein [Gaiellaceae bacterium]
MEFRDVLRRRRMVRNYRPEPVEGETIERIVRTVRRAPSGGFSQGQRLLVVTDAATREALAALAGEEEYLAKGYEAWISRAPVHIVVCTREEDYHERYRQPDKLRAGEEIVWPVPYWYVDAGAAMMLLLLAAIDEGLVAGVFGVLEEQLDPLKRLLGLPEDFHFVAVVTLGLPADDAAWSKATSRATRGRKELDEIVRWERWSPAGE